MDPQEQPLLSKEKKDKFDSKLASLIFISLLTNAGQSYVLPFYPKLAHEQAGISITIIGVLMSVKSVGSLVAAYTFGTKIQAWGRKRFLLIALVSQSIVMILYAILYILTQYYYLFLGVSIIIRLLEGVMRSIQQVICMAYINIFYKDTFKQKFSLMESTASLGQIIGPVIGSVIYKFLGYWIPLLGLAVIYWGCSFYFVISIPSDDKLGNVSLKKKSNLPLGPALGKSNVLIVFSALVVSRASLIYFNSFFVAHMEDSYHVGVSWAAAMMSIPQTTYMISIVFISYLLQNQSLNRFYFSLSLVVAFLGCGVVSPLWPDQMEIHHIWSGLILIGLGAALNRLPSIPVFQEQLREAKLETSSKQEIIDMASALLQMSLSVSNLVFPSLGGTLYDIFGNVFTHESVQFQFTMLSLVFLQIFMFTIDLVFNRGYQAWGLAIKGKKQQIHDQQQQQDFTKIQIDDSNTSIDQSLDTRNQSLDTRNQSLDNRK